MKVLSIDIETFSSVDIKYAGVYKYVESPDFEILMAACKVDNQLVRMYDLTEVNLPTNIRQAILDPAVLKTAYNANFEITCLSKHLGVQLDPAHWDCTMIRAARAGWPMNLGATAKAMGLEQEKMTEGKKLIVYFSTPCKPTKVNGMRTRNLPQHAPDMWKLYKSYCVQDVVVETSIRDKVLHIPVPADETELWNIDQIINQRGIELDMGIVNNAIRINAEYVTKLDAEAFKISGIQNMNSGPQVLEWLERQGESVPDLKKETVTELLKGSDLSPDSRRVLEIRQETSKTSIKKYTAMTLCVGAMQRVRGLFQFYGANRTGRWGGRLIQPQNLPKNFLMVDHDKGIDDLDIARQCVINGDGEGLEIMFGNVPDALSQLIRTAFVAGKGKEFIVSDFSAIEARVIAWLAGEKWRLDVFNTHGKIYEASASTMFNVPLETIAKGMENYYLRAIGKVAELACGYQGGVGALEKMGGDKMGLSKKRMKEIIKQWRAANPNITQLWDDVQEAVFQAINKPKSVFEVNGLEIWVEEKRLQIKLPSGRCLCYINPRIIHVTYEAVRTKDPAILAEYAEDPETPIYEYVNFKQRRRLPFMVTTEAAKKKPVRTVSHVVYDGLDQQTRQWKAEDTYGGKLVENCLAGDTLVLTNYGWLPLVNVCSDMLLWDGLDWVHHEGLIEKGFNNTVTIDGVRLTEDHLILTENGWKNAPQSEGLSRHKDTFFNRCKIRRFRRKEIAMVDSLRLRKRIPNGRVRVFERKAVQLWVSQERTYRREKFNSRQLKTQNVPRLAIDESKMPKPELSRMEKLRRQRNNCLQPMVGRVQILLGRHARRLSAGIDFGKKRREPRVLQRELQLENYGETSPKSEKQYVDRNSVGVNNSSRGIRKIRNRGDYTSLSVNSELSSRPFIRETGRYEQVYDLVNAGPRHRFMVKSPEGEPFIVHNCVQAIARDCLAYSLLQLHRAGYCIVLHVHDEIVIQELLKNVEKSMQEVDRIMSAEIPWAKGLPLKAESYRTYYYKKD